MALYERLRTGVRKTRITFGTNGKRKRDTNGSKYILALTRYAYLSLYV